MEEILEQTVLQLYELGAIKFGSFVLKSGIISPIYIDFRILPSFPKLLKQVSQLLYNTLSKDEKEEIQVICGVPYSALAFASNISTNHDIPMIICRKEMKEYGTKKQVEGVFNEGDSCLIVEDVLTSGMSISEVVRILRRQQLKIKYAIVLMDREQGGVERLEKEGVHVKSVFKLTKVLKILEKKIENVEEIYKFLKEGPKPSIPSLLPKKEKSFEERTELAPCKGAKYLFKLMSEKKTNLALAADVTTTREVLELAETIGSEICILKTHIDTLSDFSLPFLEKLTNLAKKHNFLIFEDRKFADIGNTVKHQYEGGIYKISSWADIINAHLVSGTSIIEALQQCAKKENASLFLIAEMSSKGALNSPDKSKQTMEAAIQYKDFVSGFICQGRLDEEQLGFVYCTPGVSISSKNDKLGQQYNSPEYVIQTKKSDVIIVGRGIYQSENILKSAQEYRKIAWEAYEKRIRS